MKTVYRIENKYSRTGPYLGASRSKHKFIREMLEEHSDVDTHPNGFFDGLGAGFFACPTLKMLKKWFGKYFEMLIKTGEFVVTKYVVSDYEVGKSGKQVVFTYNNVVSRKVVTK